MQVFNLSSITKKHAKLFVCQKEMLKCFCWLKKKR